jgi:hypothetical protein
VRPANAHRGPGVIEQRVGNIIYAILAPDFEETPEMDDPTPPGFVQIEGFGSHKKLD